MVLTRLRIDRWVATLAESVGELISHTLVSVATSFYRRSLVFDASVLIRRTVAVTLIRAIVVSGTP